MRLAFMLAFAALACGEDLPDARELVVMEAKLAKGLHSSGDSLYYVVQASGGCDHVLFRIPRRGGEPTMVATICLERFEFDDDFMYWEGPGAPGYYDQIARMRLEGGAREELGSAQFTDLRDVHHGRVLMASSRQPYDPSFEVPIMLLGDTRPPVVITEPFRDLTLDGDDVFVALVSGQLLRIRLSDGVFQHIDGGDHWVAEEVVVSDGTVFVTGARGVFAIDREGNGARQLLPPPPQGAQRTLLVEGSFLYAAQWLSDPSVLYRVATDGSGATIVARHARMYYMASDAGSVYFQFGESPSRWTIAALDHPGVQP